MCESHLDNAQYLAITYSLLTVALTLNPILQVREQK